MTGSFPGKDDNRWRRIVAIALAILLALAAIGIAIAFTAVPHVTTDFGMAVAWAKRG